MTTTELTATHEAPTTAEKIRKLPWSYLSTGANTVFAQFTLFGSAFILLLSALGVSKTGIGVLQSLFPFFGLTALLTSASVARFGYKRTYITFWGARKFVTAGLLLTPWVLAGYGPRAAAIFVAVIVATFALCRAIGETGNYPWVQEYVPASVRGKFSATENLVGALSGLLAVGAAGAVLRRSAGLSGFMILIAAGFVFGLVSVWAAAHLPGGKPAARPSQPQPMLRNLLQVFRYRDFRLYLIGAGLITLSLGPQASFLPLFMREQVGLNVSQVVWLQTGSMLGGLLTSFGWGWAADRYGGKPIMLTSLALIAGAPLLWMLMPRHSPLSFYAAFSIALLQGLLGMGWAIGASRQLFVGLVPPDKKAEFMAVHYAWMGAVGGFSQIAAGRMLDYTGGMSGQLFAFRIDPYTLLFLAGVILPAIAFLLMRGIRSDSRVSAGEFAGMFVHGNLLLAAGSLIRYNLARDEEAAVTVTERLGQARSPLTVDELVQTLADPRFNVRFEAIIALSRMPADAQVLESLTDLVNGNDPALAAAAAWGLGRLGDRRAIPALRRGLASDYRSVQGHCSRALGTLEDQEIGPYLLERFKNEGDHGLRLALAAALGKLAVPEATQPLLDFLHTTQGRSSRLEIALALARLVDDEHNFVQLWRHTRTETGTALSDAVVGIKRRLGRGWLAASDVGAAVDAAADSFARDDLDRGAGQLAELARCVPRDGLPVVRVIILDECARQLAVYKADRIEYVLLALHTLHANSSAAHSLAA